MLGQTIRPFRHVLGRSGILLPLFSCVAAADKQVYRPVELRDTTGAQVAPTVQAASQPEGLPDFLRWSCWEVQQERRHTISHFIPYLDFFAGYAGLASFQVQDYFQIKAPGDNKLTIWPKIYRRPESPEEDRDLYQRIDIPPVTGNHPLALTSQR